MKQFGSEKRTKKCPRCRRNLDPGMFIPVNKYGKKVCIYCVRPPRPPEPKTEE